MVAHIRRCLVDSCEWKIAWEARRCNNIAYNLTKWLVKIDRVGVSFAYVIIEHIHVCDMLMFD